METAIFIFFNVIIGLCFYYGKTDKEYGFLSYLIGGIFSLFIVAGILSGIKFCCDGNLYNSLPVLVSGFMIVMYFIFSLGFFTLASVSYKNKDFTGGF